MSDAASSTRVTGAFTEVITVDLLGRPLVEVPAANEIDLIPGPGEIRTVLLRGWTTVTVGIAVSRTWRLHRLRNTSGHEGSRDRGRQP
jgi:hypothetical protein